MATERIHVPIDKFGRVVLPKPLRERLGLREGTELQVEETDDAILLKPVITGARLVQRDGFLVVEAGKMTRKETIVETIERVREERDKSLW